MTKNSDKILAKYVIEVRTQPQLAFIDHKGQVADTLSKFKSIKLTSWAPSENRIDMISEDNKAKTFVSFVNYGLSFDNVSPANIVEIVEKYFDELFNQTDLYKRDVIRIGIKSTFISDKNLSFEDIKNNYQRNFLSVNPDAIKVIGAELIDVGAPFNFKISENERFNTNSGPMNKLQMRDFFQDKRTFPDGVFPESGLYFDIDYFSMNIGKTNKTNIISLIKKNLQNSIQIFTDFTNQILK